VGGGIGNGKDTGKCLKEVNLDKRNNKKHGNATKPGFQLSPL
jgi:hypothetical protein